MLAHSLSCCGTKKMACCTAGKRLHKCADIVKKKFRTKACTLNVKGLKEREVVGMLRERLLILSERPGSLCRAMSK